jgi:hypothetical protein
VFAIGVGLNAPCASEHVTGHQSSPALSAALIS